MYGHPMNRMIKKCNTKHSRAVTSLKQKMQRYPITALLIYSSLPFVADYYFAKANLCTLQLDSLSIAGVSKYFQNNRSGQQNRKIQE